MATHTRWTIDPAHSLISFNVRHLMIAHVKGEFKMFDANIYTTDKDFSTAEIDVWMDVSSLETGDAKRNEHLKSEEFFDAETYKQITFRADGIERAGGEGMHDIWGNLTMKGITRHIKLQVQFGGMLNDPWGNERAGFTVTGKLNRSDWGLVWNTVVEARGLMVSDVINISCELEVTNTGNKEVEIKWESLAEPVATL